MAKHRFIVEGSAEAQPAATSPLLSAGAQAGAHVLVFAAELAVPGRAGGASALTTPPLAGDDLVEIALEGGGHLWMAVAEFESSELIDVDTPRARGPRRVGARLRSPQATRGLGDTWIRALRFFRIELPAGLAKAGKRRIVETIEGALGSAPGLYRLDDTADVPLFVPLGARARFDKAPYLVFIHGTHSSTAGSFGDLWSADGGAAIRALRAHYGRGHLLALQHRSLSESPVDNALAIAKAVPAGVRLDLVTHSRGGLVGELLARATVAPGEAPFDEAEFTAFRAASSPTAAAALRELGALLARRRYVIDRFVRVACPARGTTLASDKLERWCNVLLNLLDTGVVAEAAVAATPLFVLLKATLRQLVRFDDLPGLAAMAPSSALVKLLNGSPRSVGAGLCVIGGDTEGGGWTRRVGMLLVDAFFGRDNDLVVDTASMCGGAPRRDPAHAHLQRAADIHHLCYFRHATTRERILRALCEDDPLRRHAGFEVIAVQPAPARAPVPLRAVSRSGSATPPIVYVLPGIMGTHLRVKDERVWLDYGQLVFGGFGKLKVASRQVVPDGLDGDTYADLVEFLSRSHEVVPFGYDWRLSIEDAAARLNADLLAKLDAIDRAKQPIRLVAHSMGGLVARAMMLRADSAWPALCTHAGARLLMLGTPNAGSHAITQMLFGEEKLVRMLATFDLGHDLGELVGQIAEFPGPLDLLPASTTRSYFDAATWNDLATRAMPDAWPLPTSAALARARAGRDRLDTQVLDPQRVFYVAGQADGTPVEIDLEPRGRGERLRFRMSAAGDGRVPWDGGIPAGIRAWYAQARHGDLAAHARAHAGYLDILEGGDTASSSLRTQRPSTARDLGQAQLTRHAALATDVASLPTRDELARAAAGRDDGTHVSTIARSPLPVRVSWGDLRHAGHAVMVGHYDGDSIISAEAAIDRALDGRLSREHRLGTYPGAIGSTLAVLDARARPRGVVVIGLGAIGRLTPGDLGDAVARGVVEWIGAREDARQRHAEAPAADGLSLLLIGSGEGGVDADTSVYSILRGVIEGIERGRRAGIASTLDALEFVELFQDRAHRLWHALDRLLAQGELRERFALAGPLVAIGDGRTRLWEAAPTGWWRRLQVGLRESAAAPQLAFTSLTDSARSETWLLPYQADVVDTLVAQSIAQTTRDEGREKALFELILPNAIKERAPQRESLVLLLDRATANLPWELLSDPLGGAADEARPLAIRAGLVRQFATQAFRARPSVVVDNTALVIGDPLAPAPAFAELKGAQREAIAVAEVLRANGRFRVEHLQRPRGDAVVQTLLPQAFRILHIAGHGMLADSGLDRDSGIVLDAFNLTWASLDQMRAVPELVFINCCHLGRVAEDERDPALALRNRFAAGVGEVFIRNGARAVIAAGWAVEDLGAETFARTFYAQMLAGERFGNAVRAAREATFDAEPRSNTWGAYQCYGDPDYRLVIGGGAAAASPPPRYASIEELVTDAIDTLASRTPADEAERDHLRRHIEAVLARHAGFAPDDDARVQLALARAWARGGFVDEALLAYARAQVLDAGRLDLGDCERRAVLGLRRAERLSSATARERRQAAAGIGDTLDAIAALLALARTRDRQVLLGQTWQLAARLRNGVARRRALRSAQIALESAASIAGSARRDDDARRAAALAALVALHGGTPTRTPRRRSARRDEPPHPLDVLVDVLARGGLDRAHERRLLAALARADAAARAETLALATYASALLTALRGQAPRTLGSALSAVVSTAGA